MKSVRQYRIVTNFGFEPTPVISIRLPVECNVPVKVNDLKRKDHPMQDSNSNPKGPSHL